jgi:signal transduction histidine kinase
VSAPPGILRRPAGYTAGQPGTAHQLARGLLWFGNMSDGDVNTADQTHRRALLTERLSAAGTLAEGLSHEVHNPLNCALLQLAVLQRRLEQPDCQPATLQPVAELVEQALRRLELLFNDFVSLAQPRAWRRVPLAVGDRCRGVVTVARADADATGIRVGFDLVLELPPGDGGLSMLLENPWPGLLAASSGDAKLVLWARPPGPPP